MSRRHAIFNSADAGTSLSVEQGGQVVTTAAAGLNINRTVRGTLGVSGNSNFAEFIVYGSAASLANRVSIGVATSAASLASYAGGDASGYGYRVGEGQIHHGGGSVASVSAGAMGDVVGVLLTYTEASIVIAWYLNGTLLTTITLDGGSPVHALFGDAFYFAVSLGSTAEADIQVRVNTGRTQFEYPNPSSDGWWSVPALPAAVRVSDVPYITTPTDSPANTRYKGCITAAGFQVSRRMQVWPWGDGSATSGSSVSLTITDPDHEFDDLLSGQFRDEPISLKTTDTSLEDAVDLGEMTFERCEIVDDLTKRIIGRDLWAKLEATPLQRRYFRPDATAGAANRPCPLVLGAAFSVPVVPFDEDTFYYMIDSVGVEQVGHVRVEGVIVYAGSSPVGYTLTQSGQVLDLTNNPGGVVTADVAVTGSTYTPQAPVDALGGTGSPFTGDVGTGAIDNWLEVQDQPALMVDHTPYYLGSNIVAFPQRYYARSHIECDGSPTVQLIAGTRYRWAFTVVAMPPNGPSTTSPIVGLTYFSGMFGAYASVNGNNFRDGNPAQNPREFSGTFTCAVTHTPNVFYEGNELTTGTCRIRALTFIELPPLDDTADEDAVEDSIAALALPLEDMLRAIIEERALFSSSIWSDTDAAAIDTATGYTGSGYCAIQQATTRDAIAEILDGYTASMFLDRSGVLRVKRLIAPESVAVGSRYGELRTTRMLSDLIPQRDDAPGLTRSMGARKNELVLSDADLDTADADVTLRVRRRLARTHRYIQTTGTPLAAGYEHAEVADYIGTRLVMSADAQAEADRIGAIYASGRSFYTVDVVYQDDLEVGDVLTVYYPYYGFSEGVALMVVGIEEDRIAQRMTLTLWGLAPEEL